MKKKIKEVLIKLHLLSLVKRLYLKLRKFASRFFGDMFSRKSFYNDFNEHFQAVDSADVTAGGIAVVGILCSTHKPTLMPFLSQIQKIDPQKQIVLLDESKEKEVESPFLRVEIPRCFPGRYEPYLELPITTEEEQLLAEKPFLQDAVLNICSRNIHVRLSYAKVLVCKTYLLYIEMLEKWKPSCVMIWSQFSPLHSVCAQACREKNIDPVFMEFGVLPGTFALERGGQMGESEPAVNWQEFLKLPVTEEQLDEAVSVLEYLRKSRLNRNIQPQNCALEALKKKLKPGRPIVLFAGQKDPDSGMVPYNDHARMYHSPSFSSSLEAESFLAGLAKKNDWNFIFKPHPGMVSNYTKENFASNTIYVDNVDLNELIDMVDVVVTIMSQTAYVSLIRERAVVMLGYNQLRGKGCTYEAFSQEEIEHQIKDAIKYGYTPEQKEQFVLHTAQLVNYYLFDDLGERSVRYGKCSEQFIYSKDGTPN